MVVCCSFVCTLYIFQLLDGGVALLPKLFFLKQQKNKTLNESATMAQFYP